jgi:mono/diheme cytochrome c family protein
MKRQGLPVAAAALAGVFLASACLSDSQESRVDAPPTANTNAPATNTPTQQPAIHEGPLEGADLANARALFKANCATCHLESGTGDPHHRKDGIPDFTNAPWQAERSDLEVSAAVRAGKGKLMPAFEGKLSTEEIGLLVHYIREMPKMEGSRQTSTPSAARPGAAPSKPKTRAAPKPPPKPAQDHSGHGNHP